MREIEINDEELENFLGDFEEMSTTFPTNNTMNTTFMDEISRSTTKTTTTSTTTTTSKNTTTFTPNSFLYGIKIHSNFSNATGCDNGPIKTETNLIVQNRSFDSFKISTNGLVSDSIRFIEKKNHIQIS
jgi:hypothetical protein